MENPHTKVARVHNEEYDWQVSNSTFKSPLEKREHWTEYYQKDQA